MPQRIQRRRTKGWRMPEGAVSVTRPSVFGNPWRVVVGEMSASAAVDMYRRWLTGDLPHNGVAGGLRRVVVLARLNELRGKDLACFCPLDGQPCHADVLLELANS